MKFINKLSFIALSFMLLTACDSTELDLLDNPNAITPDKVSINDLYNNIQLTFANVYSGAQFGPGAAARMYHASGFTYEANTTPNSYNGLWDASYTDLFEDIETLLAITDEQGLDIHSGSAKIMKAYTLMVLVDLFGDIPFSESGQGTDIISPMLDDGSAVYSEAIKLLEEAIDQLTDTNAALPAYNNVYSSAASWITLANTLKMRAALTTRLTNSSAAAEFKAVLDGGDFIDNAGEDFQFNTGNQRINPNSRHQFYNNHYELGDGNYLSNYYMWKLRADKTIGDSTILIDPRIRYYFYRKVDNSTNQDLTVYSCHFSEAPIPRDEVANLDFWEDIDDRLPYCVAFEDGYYGRDHLNGSGIPPDGPIRTSYGLYPGGGSFDGNSFTDTRQLGTSGGLGEGIWPIMLSSFVNFMRAEAALVMGTGEDAKEQLELGIRASMAKVSSFESLVPTEMAAPSRPPTSANPEPPTVKEAFGMTAEDIDNYVSYVLSSYDAADDAGKLDIIITEYYLAAWGNGLEVFNSYRRTGYPGNMTPALEQQAGQFPNSFLLPNNHVDRNANVEQKTLSDRVFWDDGSANVY